jgi:uncharacterized protein YjaG (DUF416 family)
MNGMSEIAKLSATIKELEGEKALAFGLCLLERAMPAFLQYQADTGRIGGGEMRTALAQCWGSLERPRLDFVSLVSVQECERVMPDPDASYASDYTSAAVDAVDITCNLLVFLESRDLDVIVDSVNSRCDTIELFVQIHSLINTSSHDVESELSDHPMVRQEFDFIRGDLDFLRSVNARETVLFSSVLERVLTLDYGKLRLKLPHMA